MQPFLALTDMAWFDFLAGEAVDGRVDEVNFWSPRATGPMKRMLPGEPVFFRLKRPHDAVAGYGFFAHFTRLGLDECWSMFGWRNGDLYEAAFRQRIGRYRGVDLIDPHVRPAPMACTVLRDVRFWPRSAWMPWGEPEGWAKSIMRGKIEQDPVRAQALLDRIAHDAIHREVEAELCPKFEMLGEDERRRREAEMVVREGQGTFRARLLDAYENRCAVTGEHTEPVLDAAHIQRYLGPRSNHVQNGLILTKEFHTLFDMGYVGITPDYRVRVSPVLRNRWNNGHRYYTYADRQLLVLPSREQERPSREALDWHLRTVFKA